MADFYITFGQKDSNRKDGWVRLINCENRDMAQEFAMEKYNSNFSMIYSSKDFKSKYFPKGELAVYEIDANPLITWMNKESRWQN